MSHHPNERSHLLQQAAWYVQPRPLFVGSNDIRLLRGGDALFPAMIDQIERAEREVWLATYIVHNDAAVQALTAALARAVRRGVQVHVVADGFGSLHTVSSTLAHWAAAGVAVAVYRPVRGWWNWLKPGHLRRLHMKLCVVDGQVGFVGGVNLIDDRIDLRHGRSEQPRLDYSVQVSGPVVAPIEQTTRAMWTRAQVGRDWRDELAELMRGPGRLVRARGLMRQLRMGLAQDRREAFTEAAHAQAPMRAAFVVRDNLRQRRTIERSYIDAIARARQRIDLVSPYFYPGHAFRRALRKAARRGVQVRLLLQGKIDYRFAAMAARVLYGELLGAGVRIFEYTPAFLHAKVAIVDDSWATVGSSNIDPLSLLVNLEANVIVRDSGFVAELAGELDVDFAASSEVPATQAGGSTWAVRVRRGLVAWAANLYLRIAGINGRY
ncbi:cardiolipin synthase ClsB [Aquabacterium sp.]|uniref:cardiolipin synthase ClsB n=1 Tax=Aquabacterium sp. TaxID=1872578 RepID=UPI0035AEC4F2